MQHTPGHTPLGNTYRSMGSRLAFAMGANSFPVHRHTPMHAKRLLTMSAPPEVLCLDCTGTIMRIKGSMPR